MSYNTNRNAYFVQHPEHAADRRWFYNFRAARDEAEKLKAETGTPVEVGHAENNRYEIRCADPGNRVWIVGFEAAMERALETPGGACPDVWEDAMLADEAERVEAARIDEMVRDAEDDFIRHHEEGGRLAA